MAIGRVPRLLAKSEWQGKVVEIEGQPVRDRHGSCAGFNEVDRHYPEIEDFPETGEFQRAKGMESGNVNRPEGSRRSLLHNDEMLVGARGLALTA